MDIWFDLVDVFADGDAILQIRIPADQMSEVQVETGVNVFEGPGIELVPEGQFKEAYGVIAGANLEPCRQAVRSGK